MCFFCRRHSPETAANSLARQQTSQFNEKKETIQKEILGTPAAAAAPSIAGTEIGRITDVGIDIIVNQSIDSIPLTPPDII